jgi:uncharacterized membrane protein
MIFNNRNNYFLTKEEIERITNAIRSEEATTNGEIRLCIESRCKYTDPMDKVRELFCQLKMNNTENRNAVLIYIAYKDKDFALFADKGIYEKVDTTFWQQETKRLSYHFHLHHYADGLIKCIDQVGKQLQQHYPQVGIKKNELPDDIVFGK